MNTQETKNNMIIAWLNYNYSSYAMEYHLNRYGKEKLEDFPFFARSWKGECDF